MQDLAWIGGLLWHIMRTL